jgi:hypothetical protein
VADIITAGGTITLEANTGIADSTGTAGLDIDSGTGAISLTHDGTSNGTFVDYISTEGDSFGLTVVATTTSGVVTFDSLSTGTLTLTSVNTAANNLTVTADGAVIATNVDTTTGSLTLATSSGTMVLTDVRSTTGAMDIDATGVITVTDVNSTSGAINIETSGAVDIAIAAGGIATTLSGGKCHRHGR